MKTTAKIFLLPPGAASEHIITGIIKLPLFGNPSGNYSSLEFESATGNDAAYTRHPDQFGCEAAIINEADPGLQTSIRITNNSAEPGEVHLLYKTLG